MLVERRTNTVIPSARTFCNFRLFVFMCCLLFWLVNNRSRQISGNKMCIIFVHIFGMFLDTKAQEFGFSPVLFSVTDVPVAHTWCVDNASECPETGASYVGANKYNAADTE